MHFDKQSATHSNINNHKDSLATMIKKFSFFASLVLVILVTAAWAFEDSEVDLKKEGLRGILPELIPLDIDQDSFDMLGGNWSDWSIEVADTVMELFSEEIPDIEGQREILGKLKDKIAVMDKAIDDKRYAPILDTLITLRGRLDRRVSLYESILDTLELDPEEVMKEKQAVASEKILTALNELESYLNRRSASAWFTYIDGENVRTLVQGDNSEEVSPAIVKLYNKLNGRNTLEDEAQKKFLSLPYFVKLEKASEEFLLANNATYLGVDQKELRSLLSELCNSVETLEETNSKESSARVAQIMSELKPLLADEGEMIATSVNDHYFNYNFRVLVSEYFVNRVARETESDTASINDYILGARVTGNQSTTYYTGVTFLPSGWGAKFELTLNGNVSSNTVGMTRYANVYTNGNHTFRAAKELVYDGVNLKETGKDSTIDVNARNTTTGIGVNDAGPLGLFEGTVRRRAQQEVARKRGQSEAIARQKIRDQVLPRFNDEVEKALTEINNDLENKISVRLKNAEVYPTRSDIRSSRTHLFMNHQIGESNEPGGDIRNPTQTPNIGITVHLHESLFNNVIDKLNLSGRTMTEDDVVAEVETFLSKFLGRPFSFKEEDSLKAAEDAPPQPDAGVEGEGPALPEPAEGEEGTTEEKSDAPAEEANEDDEPTILVFSKEDPVRFRFENGYANIIVKAGIKQKDDEDIPEQIITIPIKYTVRKDDILVQAGTIQVSPVEPPDSSSVQIARAGVIRKKLRRLLIDRTQNRTFDYSVEGKKPLPIAISTIKILNGWAMIWTE